MREMDLGFSLQGGQSLLHSLPPCAPPPMSPACGPGQAGSTVVREQSQCRGRSSVRGKTRHPRAPHVSYAACGGPAGRPGAGSGGDLSWETPSPGAFTMAQPGGSQLGPQCSLPSWLLVNFLPASSPHRGSLGAPKLSLKQIRQQDGRLGPGAKPDVTIKACFPRCHRARPEEVPTPMAPFVGGGSQVTTSYQGAPDQWLLPLCRLGLLGRLGEMGGEESGEWEWRTGPGEQQHLGILLWVSTSAWGCQSQTSSPSRKPVHLLPTWSGLGACRGPQSCWVTGWVFASSVCLHGGLSEPRCDSLGNWASRGFAGGAALPVALQSVVGGAVGWGRWVAFSLLWAQNATSA